MMMMNERERRKIKDSECNKVRTAKILLTVYNKYRTLNIGFSLDLYKN